MSFKRLSALIMAFVMIAAICILPVTAEESAEEITILFTHDLHSHFLPSVDENGNDIVLWAVTEKGVKLEGTYDYEGAKAAAKAANAAKEVTYYGFIKISSKS